MLKDKSQKELLEIVYKLENEKNGMVNCFNKQSDVLRQLSKAIKPKSNNIFLIIINFLTSPFALKKVLNENSEYFYSIKNKQMKFTEEKLLEAFGKVAAFENKELNPDAYKAYFMETLGVKGVCSSCGDVQGRMHGDFQKRLLMEAANLSACLLKPIIFESGKYSTNGSSKNVPLMCFSDLRKTKANIEKDAKNFGERGLKAQHLLLLGDAKMLGVYIDEKLHGVNVVKPDESGAKELIVTTSESTKGEAKKLIEPDESEQSEAFKESEAYENELNEASADEAIEAFDNSKELKEANAEVIKSEIPEAVAAVIDSAVDFATKNPTGLEKAPEYNNESAKLMKEKGLSNTEIGKHYGVSESTIRKRLKKFEAENEAKK